MIRTFIAVDLPVSVRNALEVFERELQKIRAPIAWVKPDRIHLTLKFLGDVAPEKIPDIQAALEKVAASTHTFRLQPMGCGAFPSLKQMRVVWVGLRGDNEPLAKLKKQVEAAMIPLGFEPENRPFRPHLTLGRVKGMERQRPLQEALLANQAFEAEAFDVTELVLYKSDLKPDGAVYTPLFQALFGSEQ